MMSTTRSPSSLETRKRKTSSPYEDGDDGSDESYATGQEEEQELMNDEDILLVVDLMDSDSINKYFPMQTGKGNEYNVPLHIRGFDKDYENTFWKIRHYRMMSLEDQQLELLRGDTTRMDKKEQQIYYSRIESMVKARNKFRIARRAAEDHIAAMSARKKSKPSQHCTTVITDDSDGSISVSPHAAMLATAATSTATPAPTISAPKPDTTAIAQHSTTANNAAHHWNHAISNPAIKGFFSRLVNYPNSSAVDASAATALLAAATALAPPSAHIGKSTLTGSANASSTSIPTPATIRSHPGTTTSSRGRHASSSTATTRSLGPYSKAVHHGNGRPITLPNSQASMSDMTSSMKKCIPMKPPIPAKFQGYVNVSMK